MSSNFRAAVLRGAQTRGVSFTDSIATFDPEETAMLADPARAAEKARMQGYEAGYAEGLERARADIEMATDDANKRVRRALGALTVAIDEFEQRETTAIAVVENEIVAAAFEIAQSILEREILSATDPGADAIARALNLLHSRGPALIRLNPEDAATLNMSTIDTAGRTIEVIADPAVEPGGCLVESDQTTIDARLSSALVKVAKALGL